MRTHVFMYMCMCKCFYLPNPFTMDMMQREFFFKVKYNNWFEFSFRSPSLVVLTSLPNHLFLAGRGKADGFVPFEILLAWSETNADFSRIWTRVIDSMFFGDNRYVSVHVCVCVWERERERERDHDILKGDYCKLASSRYADPLDANNN